MCGVFFLLFFSPFFFFFFSFCFVFVCVCFLFVCLLLLVVVVVVVVGVCVCVCAYVRALECVSFVLFSLVCKKIHSSDVDVIISIM